MSLLAEFFLLGWLPAVCAAFALWSPRKAVLIAVVAGWMFLPEARGYSIPGFIDYNKRTVVVFAVMAGVLAVDMQRLQRFRFGAVDLPMLVFCLVPAASTLANGVGGYAAMSAALYQTFTWGGPYFIGRLYFSDREGLQALALAIFIGGLVYVPLCLYEIRLSPQLHRIFYGYQQHKFSMTLRGGGFRPMVFMASGLMLSIWMAVSSLLSYAFLVSRGVKTVCRIPTFLLVIAMLSTTLLCKSTGALALLALAIAALEICRHTGGKALLWVLVFFPVAYVGSRILGFWSGAGMVDLALLVSEDRADSLQFRMDAEDDLIQSMSGNRILGRGPMGFNTVPTENQGTREVTVDSLWIIEFARWGGVALISMFATFLYPIYGQLRKIPARLYFAKENVCAIALAVALTIFLADCVFNAMVNPVYLLIMGGLTGYVRSGAGRQMEPA